MYSEPPLKGAAVDATVPLSHSVSEQVDLTIFEKNIRQREGCYNVCFIPITMKFYE